MKMRFLIKSGDRLKLITSHELEQMDASQALVLALACRAELTQQLLKDSAKDSHKKYYGYSVVKELESSLSKIEQLYPSMLDGFDGNNKRLLN